jgi:hypothetical protein
MALAVDTNRAIGIDRGEGRGKFPFALQPNCATGCPPADKIQIALSPSGDNAASFQLTDRQLEGACRWPNSAPGPTRMGAQPWARNEITMAASKPDPHQNPDFEPTGPTERQMAALCAQAEELTWKLLDGQLPEAEYKRLEQMLLEHELVRRRYLECVHMHVDLYDLLGQDPRPEQILDQPPILGMLGNPQWGEMPGTGDLPSISYP